jgi:hypothetical protein
MDLLTSYRVQLSPILINLVDTVAGKFVCARVTMEIYMLTFDNVYSSK